MNDLHQHYSLLLGLEDLLVGVAALVAIGEDVGADEVLGVEGPVEGPVARPDPAHDDLERLARPFTQRDLWWEVPNGPD